MNYKLKKIAPYFYDVEFLSLPEDLLIPPVKRGCSSYVQNGKLYRNLDWSYSETASFRIKLGDITGMGFVDGLTDGNLDETLISQLPYHMVDGINQHGIMISTHVLYNDWEYAGSGNTPINNIPYIILSRIESLDDFPTKIAGVLSDISIPTVLEEMEYLLQFLVTDGETTYVIMPPESSSGAFVCENITNNPKLANFRWVPETQVVRQDLQERPTGVERWNAMPGSLKNLEFTEAYKAPTRLSEFIGLDGTTKDSTDAELLTIYAAAHELYEHRERDGRLWQTMHSVVYSKNGIEELYVQEDWSNDYAMPDTAKILLPEIKNDLDITWDDEALDKKLIRYIRDGIAYLDSKYGGNADYVRDGFPRTLLFKYVQYAYDKALDVFENNYMGMLLAMQNMKAVKDYEGISKA